MSNILLVRERRPAPLVLPSPQLFSTVRYKTRIINPDGSVAKERPFKRNLILDQGLNNQASLAGAMLWSVAVVGTGTDPVRRDSASTTMSRSGNVVTASAPFFASGDVGRLLKFDSGEEVYISAYTDTTHVETSTSGTIASASGTIWYVNQTGLQTEAKRTNTCRVEAGDNFNLWDGTDTYTLQRTFQFSAESGSVTYTEVGWSHTMSGGGNLYGRDLIPGGGDALVAGQQYQIVVQVTMKLAPATPLAVANVGGSFNTAGTLMVECLTNAVMLVNTNGDSALNAGGFGSMPWLEAYQANVPGTMQLSPVMADWTQNSAIGSPPSLTVGPNITLSSLGYVNGNFYLDFAGTWSVSQANGTIYGFAMTQYVATLKFTTPQTKLNTHSLTVTWRKRWGRTLINS